MNSAIERLLCLRVCDVMKTDVVTIHEDMTMCQAATEFDKHGITGAPVVDHAGKCVGILSVSDFARREQEQARAGESLGFGFEHKVKTGESPICIESLQEDRVSEHMSPVVQTISQDTPIMNAARVLLAEHIHRLVIVDEDLRPAGVLTSLDIVACMVAAVEE